MLRKRTFLFSLALTATLAATAQQAVELKQEKLSKWDIGTANYSGIAPVGDGRYLLVSDKEPSDGFFIFTITQES